ncbi:MAG: hypothetical protein ACKO81_15145 [Planctomycetota bacterium]
MSFSPSNKPASNPFNQPFGSQTGRRNLAQEARKQQLRKARWILIVLGVLQFIYGLFFVINARSLVKAQFEKELAPLRAQGQIVDEQKLQELEDSTTKATQLLNLGGILGGISFIFLGLLVYRFPVACTVTGLLLYIGLFAGFAFITFMSDGDASVFVRGWLIRLLVIIALFKAIQAALAYEKEKKAAESSFIRPPFAS